MEALGTLSSRPSISRKVRGRLSLGAAAATAEAHLHADQGDGAAASPSSVGVGALNVTPLVKTQVAANVAQASAEFTFNPLNGKIWVGGAGASRPATSSSSTATAYEHRVRRLVG